jgi:RimJ/RimL family protein N-acetyltransferase
MEVPPEIATPRLVLRPFRPGDATAVARLAGDRDVASTTASIPHPYPARLAAEWIASHPARVSAGTEVIFAVTLRKARIRRTAVAADGGRLIGAVGLILEPTSRKAEMGYWIGKPYWGKGYATEAARAVIAYGFDVLSLNRIFAHHMTRNPASGRVLEKAGMTFEGGLRQHILKWDRFEDVRIYGILRSEHRPG